MKFNKLTHLSIIVVLAVMFIVVYLYYTISDVKKIHNEVSKLTQDIEKMNQSISSITTTLMPLVGGYQAYEQQQCGLPNRHVPSVQEQTKPLTVTKSIDDGESSVDSVELHTIMETIDDEEVTHVEDAVDVATTASDAIVENIPIDESITPELTNTNEENNTPYECVVDLSLLSVDELKKVSYEDIRKFCKGNNLSYKGSKDVLIYRIKGITA